MNNKIIFLLGVCVFLTSAMAEGELVTNASKQNGINTTWTTRNDEIIVSTLIATVIKIGDPKTVGKLTLPDGTDFHGKFDCHGTGRSTTTSASVSRFNEITEEWSMYYTDEWDLLGVTDNWFPGMNSDDQDLYVAIDLLTWKNEGGSYQITGAPEPLFMYDFENGINENLPGVYVSNSPISWEPHSGADNTFRGWVSDSWFSGEAYVCHEYTTTTVPEPSTISLLIFGMLSIYGLTKREYKK